MVSLVSLIDEINRLPPFREFWSNATVDVGDYAAEVKEEHSVCWKHVRPARFIDMLVASASQPDGSGTTPKVSEAAQSGLLNPKNTEGSPFLFTGHEEGHRNARLARVLFFLAVGLGPCLPAMIHIDVAGALYAKKRRARARGTLAQGTRKTSDILLQVPGVARAFPSSRRMPKKSRKRKLSP